MLELWTARVGDALASVVSLSLLEVSKAMDPTGNVAHKRPSIIEQLSREYSSTIRRHARLLPDRLSVPRPCETIR